VDKLDKIPWDAVRKEMLEKGISAEVADKIQSYVVLKGEPSSLLKKLEQDEILMCNASANTAVKELQSLFDYLNCYDILHYVSFDLSLARGLDYYTGVIFEGLLTGGLEVGSICGGGRYDGLIATLGGPNIPAVGFSIGIERLFSIIEQQAVLNKKAVRVSPTDVMVCTIDKGLLKERMKMCTSLWNAGIRAEMLLKTDPKLSKQLDYATANNIPFTIIFGQREVTNNTVKIKESISRIEEEISRDQVVDRLSQKIEEYYGKHSKNIVDLFEVSTNNNSNVQTQK